MNLSLLSLLCHLQSPGVVHGRGHLLPHDLGVVAALRVLNGDLKNRDDAPEQHGDVDVVGGVVDVNVCNVAAAGLEHFGRQVRRLGVDHRVEADEDGGVEPGKLRFRVDC